MNRDQKTAVVEEIAGQLQDAEAIFAVDYRGISVDQVAELRTKLRAADARFRVVKNSLSERAADKAGMDNLKPMLVGPTALAFVKGDAAVAAKALNDTARQLNLLDFKGGVLNGSTLSADDVRSIARLPAREVLYAQLVGTVAAPLTGLARGLNALIGGLAIQLQAIADQGLVSGEAPVPPAAEPEAPAAEPEAAEPEAAEPEAEAPAAETETEAPAAEAEAPAAEAEAAETEAEAPAAEAEAPAEAAEPEPEAEAPAAEPEASKDTESEAASDAAPSDE
jgi:large subunit ribosomal protein L10